MFELVYCVGGSLKNLCHWQMLTSSGGSLNAERGRGGGGKICQNLADVICERSLKKLFASFTLSLSDSLKRNKFY